MPLAELFTSPTYVVAQLFGLLALVVSITSQQFKAVEKMLMAFVISNLLNGVHYYLLEAYTGLILCIIGAIRFSVAIKSTARPWLYIFLILNTIATYVVFESPLLSGTSYLASTLIVISSFVKASGNMRLLLIFGGLGWLVYGFLVGSVVAVIANALFLISCVIGWYRHSRKLPRHT